MCDVQSYTELVPIGFVCQWRWIVAVSPSEIRLIWFNNKQEHVPFSPESLKPPIVLSIKRLPDSLGWEMRIYQILPPLSRTPCQTRRQEKGDFLFFSPSPMLTSLGDPQDGMRAALGSPVTQAFEN